MVQTNSTGIISGALSKGPVDNGERITVKWDNSGMTNSWNPVFLRPINTQLNDDPEIVSDGTIYRKKGNIEYDGNGIFKITGGGFEKVLVDPIP